MNIDPEGTSWWSNLWNGISNFFSKIGEGIGKIFSGIGNLFGSLVNYNNDFGFDFDIGLDFERKSLFERFIENIEDIRKDKKYFFKDILWDKGIVPAWNWAKDNATLILDVFSAVAGIGGGIASILSTFGIISIPIAGQIFLGVVSIGFGIYGLGRAFGWW